MSTKIFNGYYIDNCTLLELQAFSMSLRSKIKDKMEELYAKKLLDLATYYHDKPYVCEPKTPNKFCSITTAKFKIDERFYNIEKTNKRDPDYDFSFDVTFIPTENKIFALIYTEQTEAIKVFKSFPNVHKYPYYDNTDRPDNISEEEWEERGKEWDKALGPFDIPALQGFSIKCLIYTPLFNKEELNEYSEFIPTFEKRVSHFAKIKLWQLFYSRYKQHYHIEPKIHEALDWIESKPGKDKLLQFKEKISKKLKPQVTIEDLLK